MTYVENGLAFTLQVLRKGKNSRRGDFALPKK
jgi:hypothetical protein